MGIISHGHGGQGGEHGSNAKVEAASKALEGFELGRFLKTNLGLNGFWTSYILLHPDKGRVTGLSSDGSPMTELESWLLNQCPIILATQERFRIFRNLTQPLLRAGMKLASIPCGLMDDLLTLDYTNLSGVTVSAVDLDSASLAHAKANYSRSGAPVKFESEERDAWKLESRDRWDLVTSNGLNIYVESDQRCVELYRSIATSLRPGGYFILSFITPVETWKVNDATALEQQRFIFRDVLPVKWQCLRSEELTRTQLAEAGFEVLRVEYDSQRMFPAVLARKIVAE